MEEDPNQIDWYALPKEVEPIVVTFDPRAGADDGFDDESWNIPTDNFKGLSVSSSRVGKSSDEQLYDRKGSENGWKNGFVNDSAWYVHEPGTGTVRNSSVFSKGSSDSGISGSVTSRYGSESGRSVCGNSSFGSSPNNGRRFTGRGRGWSKNSNSVNNQNTSVSRGRNNYSKPIPPVVEEPIRFLTGAAADKYLEEQRLKDAALYANQDYDALVAQSEKCTAEKWAKYPPIVKLLYKEHPTVAKMTPAEATRYREENLGIVVQKPPDAKGDYEDLTIPNPITKFEHAFINYAPIRDLLMKAGFEKPSPIQSQAWPLILKGHDIVGIAQTGSGKTIAFLLPAYVHILRQAKQNRSPGAHVLVMAPTRELALQIHAEVLKYNCYNLKSVVIYGGADRNEQIRLVRAGCNIIIATPGRLTDLIQAGHIDITSITFVVLDEADRMLDAGFEGSIRKTMYRIRPDRQTIMTSATWPNGVQRLANSYMKNPLQVVVGSLDLAAVSCISQSFIFLHEDDVEEKLNYLEDFISVHDKDPDTKVLVFTTTKARATYVSTELALKSINAYCLRGDMDQEDRELAIELIKSGDVKYLICTDVASRGVDIPDLTHVVNLDFPRDIEEYVHRIGRTGRAGKPGKSLTLLTRYDSKHASALIKILQKAGQEVPGQLRSRLVNFEKRMEKRKEQGNQQRPRYNRDNGFMDMF